MNERETLFAREMPKLAPKVYEGEILPPLPKQSVVQDEAQVKERIQVIRTELTHYIQKPPPPQVVIVERPKPEPQTVWEEMGEAIADGVAGVRGFIREMSPIWQSIRKQRHLRAL